MSLWTGVAVYIVIWWTVIFMVLPWGVRPVGPEEIAQGHASSAPRRPRMLLKVVITSIIAAIVWGAVALIIESGWISFRP